KINNYKERLNQWALHEFSGSFFIAIDALPFDADSLSSPDQFRKLRQLQADNLDRLKRIKFVDFLPHLFKPTMPRQLTVKTECQITRRDDLDETEMFDLVDGTCMHDVEAKNRDSDRWTWVSQGCFRQFRFGDTLIDADTVYRYKVELSERKKNIHTLVLPGLNGLPVTYSVNPVAGVDPDFQWKINTWDGGAVFLYANYVRKHGDLSSYAQQEETKLLNEDAQHEPKPDHSATFQGLAASACGADLIGALRMDVDNLGDMFSKIENMAMLSTHSRMLNLFFKVYLNKICGCRNTDILDKEKAKDRDWGKPGRNVSVIYSGGDDLFIVGAWDDAIELAFDIQHKFEQFTHGQRISGGLTVHKPKFPLYQMAQWSAEAESFAKHDKESGESSPLKNRIALFYDHSKLYQQKRLVASDSHRYMLSMQWTLARTFLLPLMEAYRSCGSIPPGNGQRNHFVIEKFSFSTVEKWFAVVEKYQLSNQLYLPTMARVMRGIQREFGDDTELFERLVTLLYTRNEGSENWISHFHIALNWLAYLRRTA
ncbi:MAG: hypothetical protein HGB26_08220, partial [Desulfobulbaceae bacterium]|nr:hypothetical protein [Desulfobulbaceae bacterium]